MSTNPTSVVRVGESIRQLVPSAEGYMQVPLYAISAVLVRRRWLIASICFAVVGAATSFALLKSKAYSSTMKILVKNERANAVVTPSSGGSPVYMSEVTDARINTELEILQSRNVLRQVVDKSGLAKLEDQDNSAAAVDAAMARLRRDLNISPVPKASVIRVEYHSPDPQLAVLVLRQLSDAYLEQHLKVHGTPGTYEFFKEQTDRYRHELESADEAISAFRTRENIVLLVRQKESLLQGELDSESALRQTEAAIEEHKDKLRDLGRQLAAAEPRIITQSRSLPNQYSVERLHTMLAEMQNRRTELLAKFRSDDRMVLEAEREIADTKAALAEAATLISLEQTTGPNPIHDTIQVDLTKEQSLLVGMEARRRTLVEQIATQSAELAKLSAATPSEEDLIRKRAEAEEKYLLYAKKTEEAHIAELLDGQKIANVAIAETPTEPHLPTGWNPWLTILLGITAGCILGFAAALGAERLSEKIQYSSDLRYLTGLPVLAVLPASALPSVDSGGQELRLKSKLPMFQG